MKEYEIVVGLEIHCELKTKTKCFCACANEFNADVNTNVCPVCLGLAGALPSINKDAVKYAIMSGLAFNCKINEIAIMERKNYFYPDLSKAYQISQLEKPFCVDGYLNFGNGKRLRINNIHLEEDAGKLIHDNFTKKSYVDFNRCGVPLIEIVTEPDLRSAEDAVDALNEIKEILTYIGVSDCKMQEGSLRCDVNVSVMEKGSLVFGKRTEMKNLNSFKAVQRAINFEANRQIELLEKGEKIITQTLRWDDNLGKNFALRSKEEANDYKYFPDPDLLPIRVKKEYVKKLKLQMPQLPSQLKDKFLNVYGLSPFDTQILMSKKDIACYFENCVIEFNKPKVLANWILSDVLRNLKNENEDATIQILPSQLIEIIKMVEEKTISTTAGKTVFDEVWKTKQNPKEVTTKLGLIQNNNVDDLKQIIEEVLKNNPNPINDYKNGNKNVLAFIVGLVMKTTKGKANPVMVNKILNEILES